MKSGFPSPRTGTYESLCCSFQTAIKAQEKFPLCLTCGKEAAWIYIGELENAHRVPVTRP